MRLKRKRDAGLTNRHTLHTNHNLCDTDYSEEHGRRLFLKYSIVRHKIMSYNEYISMKLCDSKMESTQCSVGTDAEPRFAPRFVALWFQTFH